MFDKIYVRFCSFYFLQVDRIVWKEISSCSLLFRLCFNNKCDLNSIHVDGSISLCYIKMHENARSQWSLGAMVTKKGR